MVSLHTALSILRSLIQSGLRTFTALAVIYNPSTCVEGLEESILRVARTAAAMMQP